MFRFRINSVDCNILSVIYFIKVEPVRFEVVRPIAGVRILGIGKNRQRNQYRSQC